MALIKGSKKLYDFLKNKNAGEIIACHDVMSATGWSERSLKTYISKNKIALFLMPVDKDQFKVLLDGSEIGEKFFDETFSQTAPPVLPLSAGDRFKSETKEYILHAPLGNGAVGHVWSAKELGQSTLVAVKILLPKKDLLKESVFPNVRERFRREGEFGSQLIHKNIVRYLDFGNINKNPFLIMELGARSIADKVKKEGPIPEEEAAEIIEQCAEGLLYLHNQKGSHRKNGGPHRDIKPSNLLEGLDGVIKVSDLGIVKWSDFEPTFTNGGTITRESVQLGSWFYMAPEQVKSPHEASKECDIYAMGVTWIEILTGECPTPQAVGSGEYQILNINDKISSIIRRMLSYNPQSRPGLSEILETIHVVYGLT